MSASAGIVIVGGGQAGGWAAKTLRDQGYLGRLSVISDEPYDFYERPPLSKSVLTEEDVELSRLFSPEIVASLNIDWRRPLRAESLDARQKTLTLNNGEQLEYSQLLLATGATPRVPHTDWLEHPRVHTLRSWDDAQRLKAELGHCRRLCVVGGGWIGLEIAASARRLGIDVTLFERQPVLCQRSVNHDVSQALLRLHQQHGVDMYCGSEITFSNPLKTKERPRIGSSMKLPQEFDAVVVGAGVTLNLALAEQAGLLARPSGIVVDSQGHTSDASIFAAGDIALHPRLGICLQSWSYAQNQAIATATAMLNPQAAGFDDLPWVWSDQYDNNIQILGIPSADCRLVNRCSADSQLYFFLNAQNQLVQLVAFNDARTVKLAKRWMASGRVLDPQQLANADFSLMSLR